MKKFGYGRKKYGEKENEDKNRVALDRQGVACYYRVWFLSIIFGEFSMKKLFLLIFFFIFPFVVPLFASDSPILRDWMLQDGQMSQDGQTTEVDAEYIKACQSRRNQRLKTLKEKYPNIVFVRHFDLGGSHYTYTEAQSDAQGERTFVPGSALCLLELDSNGNGDGNSNGEYVERTLLEDPNGVIRDPAVSYDAKKIVFSWKKSDRLDDYHLYDYDVETGNIRQLTFGLGYADFEPCLLPDGDIVFNSSRCVQIVDCWWTEVSNLYRCDKDGQFLRRLTYDQVHANYPAILEDGRIIYTRWDYNDRGQIFPQPLFQMNPDGTGQTEYYGNNSWFPTTLMHSRGIPDSGGKVVSIFSGHHNRQYGKLGIVDVSKGRQENQGAQLIAPIRETTADRVDAWGQHGDRFAYPYPINEHEFLVSYNSDLNAGHTTTTPFGIYWMDENGHRELLAWNENVSSHQPVPLVVQKVPYDRETVTDLNADYGTFTLQDVYFGPGMQGVARGTAKTLRVVGLEFRSTGIGSNINQGPSGAAMVCTPISVGNGSWDVKIPLGDTPIYEDGSASFKVPAKMPVYFQVLDENGHCIQTMRSWATLQPGEVFSCVGCHEEKNMVAPVQKPTIAMKKGPQPLKPFYDEPRGFSFLKDIQPILDAHCVKCHHHPDRNMAVHENGGLPAYDPQNPPFSLKGDLVHDVTAKRNWPISYLNLTDSKISEEGRYYAGRQTSLVNWLNVQDVPSMLPPYNAGAIRSNLMKMIDPNLAAGGKTHNDVKLFREELDKMVLWIDLLVPACGDYAELNIWDEQDKQKFAYYETKKQEMHELDCRNNLHYVRFMQQGEPPPGTVQADNPYRSLALKTDLCSNVDCARVDFGRDVLTDQITVMLRSDVPHDALPKECMIEGSNGFKQAITLQKTAKKQVFMFPVQKLNGLKLSGIVPEGSVPEDNAWAASAEIEVYGIDATVY